MARQAHRQAHQRRALHLCFHGARVHDQVAVHARGHAVQARPAVLHRGLDDVGHHAVERLVHRHAPGAAARELALSVAALVDRQLQRGAVPRVLRAQQLQPVGHRVLARGARDLVDQRLHHERGVRAAHAAPPQHRHVDLRVLHRQPHRQRVGRAHAFHRGLVDAVLHHAAFEEGAGHDGLPDQPVVPGQHAARAVEADLRAVQVHRPVVAAADVVLACPQRAHRRCQPGSARSLRHLAGLDHVVAAGQAAAAETAAGHLHVHLHLLGLQAQHAGRGGAVQPRHLRAHPQLGAVAVQLHGAVQRLHRRVRQVGEDELGLDAQRRTGQRRHVGVEVPRPRLLGQRAELRQQRRAVGLLDRAVVPLQPQRFAALARRPEAVGDDGHALGAAVQRHAQHGAHAGHRARGAVVHAGQLRAEHRRARHHGRQHARQPHVDAVGLLAAALGAGVQPGRRTADQPEVGRVLQHHPGRHRLARGVGGERAVGQAAAVGRQHLAGARAQRGHVELPALRGGRQQHGARPGAEFAVLHEAVLQRRGAAGEVHAPQRVGIGRVVAAVAAAHARPVGVELFGQQHRQRGLHALAELEPVDGDGDGAVGRDLHEGRGLLRRLQRGFGGRGRGGQRRGQHTEREAAAAGELQELAARQRRGLVVAGLGLVQGAVPQAAQRVRQFGQQGGGEGGGQHGRVLRQRGQASARAASATAARMRA